MNPSKLKVIELRAELSSRGLETKGNKSALIERLQEALDKESEGGGGRKEDDEEGDNDHNINDVTESELEVTQNFEKNQPDSQEQIEETPQESDSSEKVEEESITKNQTNSDKQEDNENGENMHEENDYPEKESLVKEDKEEMQQEEEEKEVVENEQKNEENDTGDEAMSSTEDQKEHEMMEQDDNTDEFPNEEKETSAQIKKEPLDSSYRESQGDELCKEERYKEDYESHVKNEPYEGNDVKHIKNENDIKSERDSYREDRKRKRSMSPSPYKSRSPPRQIREEEPDINDEDVTLSWYDSDLNLIIDKASFYSAYPMTQGGFGYMWAGVRGTYAYNTGKICFQVKLDEYCDVSHLDEEPNPNVLRVGWSTLDTSLQLGEEPLSYGYGGTGKISVNCQFSNYGQPFGEGDVITAYLEFTETEFIISYALNDENLGVAWQLPLEELNEKPLAPHILTKNVKFTVNFGQIEGPWFEIMEDFSFIKDVPIEQAIAGPKRPEKRSDCEMIMMCGLPACGKTTWANQYVKEHPEKLFNIIGTNALIDKMKVMGLPRKANYHGRWDILIDRCTKCLNKLMDVGAHRRRNFILDQTNVFPAAQRRKMRNFEGFTRKAVVIVPTDEDFKERTQKQAEDEKKDVPEKAVMEMKANFSLPDKNLFSEVTYVELDESDARALVHKYNKEASAAGYSRRPMGGSSGNNRGSGGGPNAKRFRNDFGHHQQHHGGGGGQRHDNFRRGPPPSSLFRSQYRGPPGGGGSGGHGGGGRGGWQSQRGAADRWRDNRNHGGSGGYRQGGGGNGDRGGGGWRGGNQGNNRGNRDYDDRNSRGGNFGNDRNRGGRGMGGGGSGGGGRDGGRQGGGGYSNRDGGRDNWNKRGQGGSGGGSSVGGTGGGHNSGSAGGSISASNQQSANQWGQYHSGGGQGQGQLSQSGGQSWGSQQSWGNPQQQQQWGNYQQQQGWKGYNQAYGSGYSQQGYGQAAGYGNWQYSYPGYQNWNQNWQNWYQSQNAAAANQTNTSQPPPSNK